MRRMLVWFLASLFLLSPGNAGAKSNLPRESATREEEIPVPVFGKLPVYRPDPVEKAHGLVLLVSGDGGWKLGVLGMARRIAGSAVVVGIPMTTWRKLAELHPDSCWYPAGELESIAQAVEKTYKFPRYLPPVLVGYSSGATVVYGALAQAPTGSFAGAVSLGFCPDFSLRRSFCSRREWKPSFEPAKHTVVLPVRDDLPPRPDSAPAWVVLQGLVDQVCDPTAVERFVSQVPAGKLILLPKVGHGFGVTSRWGADYDREVGALLGTSGAWEPWHGTEPSRAPNRAPAEIGDRLRSLDLSLVVTWPRSPSAVVVFVSGDGGWMELDQEVASHLHDAGIAVIGWSALRYFWEEKSPERFRTDLRRIVEILPDELPIYVGGYSFGAEVTAVCLANPEDRASTPLARIRGLVLLAPGAYAAFEVSPIDWLLTRSSPTRYPVREPLKAAGEGFRVLCLEPASDRDSGCPPNPSPGLTRRRLAGSHHFGGDYEPLAGEIASFIAGGRENSEGGTKSR